MNSTVFLLTSTIFAFQNVLPVKRTTEIIYTRSGPVRGLITENSKQYLGITYGTAKRFEAPTPPSPWSRPVEATRVGPMCYQDCPSSPPHLCVPQMSEDCLILNVFVPRGNPEGSGYAVMVFIHGGDFLSYSGSSPLFNGDVFVKKGNVILVTINYRLGAFGFLPRVVNGDVVGGNYGLLDQQLALKWVHDNIRAFGGDNNKITIFGQSAGAQSVCVHLVTPSVSHYFQRAIIQSSPMALPFRNMTEAERQIDLFARQLGCRARDIQCFRSKSASEVLQAQNSIPKDQISDNSAMQFEAWGPVIDGRNISGNLLSILATTSIDKDIIIGTTSDEGLAYVYGAVPHRVPMFLFSFVLNMFIPNSSAISSLYTVRGDARPALSKVITDFMFSCPSTLFADILSSSKNVWVYRFEQPLSIDAWGSATHCVNKTCHGVDLPFLYDTPRLVGYDVTSGDEKLSSTMIGYWTNFAKYGNPNILGILPEWPKYQGNISTEQKVMVFKEPQVIVKEAKNKKCAAMNKQGYQIAG
ncbi:crystal protein-like [Haliotis rubra]|uniref:crystal protein-like n=1 Tax=Haliotis rubra TaxID=36100 RepID=UPI001EE561F5|nr:crystal protein-like [Haliotis rubra]